MTDGVEESVDEGGAKSGSVSKLMFWTASKFGSELAAWTVSDSVCASDVSDSVCVSDEGGT